MSLRKITRLILNELHGVQENISELSTIVANDVFDTLEKNFYRINDGESWTFPTHTKSNNQIKENTKISKVISDIDFTFSKELKINGAFISSKTFLLDDGTYEVRILLKINSDSTNLLSNKIESIVSHELNHALVYVNKLSKNNKKTSLLQVNKFTSSILKDIIHKNDDLKNIYTMIYLSNPLEIQARIQQTASELKNINEKNAEDTISRLLGHNPLNDARKMIKLSINDFKNIDKNSLELYVNEFNKNIKLFTNTGDYKIIKNPNDFLNYWIKIVNKRGEELARKIYKLVSDKHNMIEYVLYEETSHGLYYKIFGELY